MIGASVLAGLFGSRIWAVVRLPIIVAAVVASYAAYVEVVRIPGALAEYDRHARAALVLAVEVHRREAGEFARDVEREVWENEDDADLCIVFGRCGGVQ